jgi:hypothetical protein
MNLWKVAAVAGRRDWHEVRQLYDSASVQVERRDQDVRRG